MTRAFTESASHAVLSLYSLAAATGRAHEQKGWTEHGHRRSEDPADSPLQIHYNRRFRADGRDDQIGGAALPDVRRRAGAAVAERRRPRPLPTGNRIRRAGSLGAEPSADRQRSSRAGLSHGLEGDVSRRDRDRGL